MARRTILLAALALAAAGGAAAGLLGVASGEGPAGSAAVRVVSVEGVGTVPIGPADNVAQADAVYREGMARALADGQAKAAFLAEHAGVALGAVVSVTEDGGNIECSGSEGREYAGYEGEWPDFGYGRTPNIAAAAPLSASARGTSAPSVSHRPKVKRHKARKASAAKCNLTANLSETYALG